MVPPKHSAETIWTPPAPITADTATAAAWSTRAAVIADAGEYLRASRIQSTHEGTTATPTAIYTAEPSQCADPAAATAATRNVADTM